MQLTKSKFKSVTFFISGKEILAIHLPKLFMSFLTQYQTCSYWGLEWMPVVENRLLFLLAKHFSKTTKADNPLVWQPTMYTERKINIKKTLIYSHWELSFHNKTWTKFALQSNNRKEDFHEKNYPNKHLLLFVLIVLWPLTILTKFSAATSCVVIWMLKLHAS